MNLLKPKIQIPALDEEVNKTQLPIIKYIIFIVHNFSKIITIYNI
jgi:hypothetical protein